MKQHLSRMAGFSLRLAGVAMLILLAVAGNAPRASAHQDASAPDTTLLPAERLVNTDGTLHVAPGFIGTLNLRGWDVTLDARRGPLLARAQARPMAIPPHSPMVVGNPTTWTPLSYGGLNNSVLALAVSWPNLYVGGMFTAISGVSVPMNYVASYNMVTGQWSVMDNGLNQQVNTLAFGPGGYLYAGGFFTDAGDNTQPELKHIALWNGAAWGGLADNGLNGAVQTLAYDGTNLWVGGSFSDDGNNTHLGNTIYNNIAQYTGSVWAPAPDNGLDNDVRAIVVAGGSLYVGGFFSKSKANTPVEDLNRIAKLTNETTWEALPNQGLYGPAVYALARDAAGNIYVGGSFDRLYDDTLNPNSLNNFAIYDPNTGGGTWVTPTGGGLTTGIPGQGTVDSLAVINLTDIYIGGTFTQSADGGTTKMNNMAIYKGSTWVVPPAEGLDGSPEVFVSVPNGTLYNVYVGGHFTGQKTPAQSGLNHIAVLANDCSPVADDIWSNASNWTCSGISGVPATPDAITIPSGRTLTLTGDVTVNGGFSFDGTINADTYLLSLGAGVIVNGLGLVIGQVERYTTGGPGPYTFNDKNTQITLDGGATVSSIAVTLKMGDPAVTNYAGRTFKITKGSGTFTSATVRLPYDPAEIVGTPNAGNFKLWSYDTGTHQWVSEGGVLDAINHYVELAGVNHFSAWAISDNTGPNGEPSSVTISSFKASVDGTSSTAVVVGALLATVAVAGTRMARKRHS